MSESVCRGCGVPIRWITTPKGKHMPVDPAHVTAWVVDEHRPPKPAARRLTLLSGDGTRMEKGLEATVHTPGAHEICGYVPHWATCPNREEFKR